jgi:hypothetical protein|tara:strand:+ start:200 stop:307 length:108 start_codon:yes stop_codon:yes gene_type:complete
MVDLVVAVDQVVQIVDQAVQVTLLQQVPLKVKMVD